MAIGKGGSNIKLASRLTGYEIDVYRDTDEEIDVIEVENNNLEDQAKKVKKIGADRTEVVGESTAENASNKMKVAQKMKAQQSELERSKQMQLEKAEKERMALEEMKKKRMAELEKRKQELQSRPKGMAKLNVSVAKGKREFDKRDVIKDRESKITLKRIKKDFNT